MAKPPPRLSISNASVQNEPAIKPRTVSNWKRRFRTIIPCRLFLSPWINRGGNEFRPDPTGGPLFIAFPSIGRGNVARPFNDRKSRLSLDNL